MLEGILIALIIINILIFMLAKIIPPADAPRNMRGARNAPAALPYDVNDFCAYHSHIVLRPFEDGGARFLFDCLLPDSDEVIDMIMLAKSGVYVFEHVKAEGWISGMENNEKWTEKIQLGSGRKPHEEKFDNPVKIAESKVHCVRELLNNDSIMVRSVVVFPDFCLLNNIKVFNPNTRIVTLNQLLPTMITLNNKVGINITQHDINEIYDRFLPYEIIPTDEEEY